MHVQRRSSDVLSPSSSLGDTESLIHAGESKLVSDGHGGVIPLQSTSRAFFNSLKAFIGSGLLGLPYAFSLAGLWLGIVAVPPVAVLSYFCMIMLVDTKYLMQKQLPRDAPEILTFPQMMTLLYGQAGKVVAYTSIVASQLGFCTVYVIFISTNMHRLVSELDTKFWILCVFPVVYGLTLLRSMRVLGPVSGFSNLCIVVGISCVIGYSADKVGHGSGVVSASSGFIQYLSGLCYAFEGIATVLPVESTMKNRRAYPGTLAWVFAVAAVIFMAFGAVGYSAYGSDVDAVITMELPGGPLTTIVLISLILAILGTYPLMAYPAVELVEKSLFGEDALVEPTNAVEWKRNGVRLGAVLLTVGLALAIPNFGLVIDFVGAFTCIPLMFIFPPLMHYTVTKRTASTNRKLFDLSVVVFGIGACGYACVQCIMSAVEIYKN
eukprot:ANDGO_06626.mRNA.1 Vacuolar amino acid transporter 3